MVGRNPKCAECGPLQRHACINCCQCKPDIVEDGEVVKNGSYCQTCRNKHKRLPTDQLCRCTMKRTCTQHLGAGGGFCLECRKAKMACVDCCRCTVIAFCAKCYGKVRQLRSKRRAEVGCGCQGAGSCEACAACECTPRRIPCFYCGAVNNFREACGVLQRFMYTNTFAAADAMRAIQAISLEIRQPRPDILKAITDALSKPRDDAPETLLPPVMRNPRNQLQSALPMLPAPRPKRRAPKKKKLKVNPEDGDGTVNVNLQNLLPLPLEYGVAGASMTELLGTSIDGPGQSSGEGGLMEMQDPGSANGGASRLLQLEGPGPSNGDAGLLGLEGLPNDMDMGNHGLHMDPDAHLLPLPHQHKQPHQQHGQLLSQHVQAMDEVHTQQHQHAGHQLQHLMTSEGQDLRKDAAAAHVTAHMQMHPHMGATVDMCGGVSALGEGNGAMPGPGTFASRMTHDDICAGPLSAHAEHGLSGAEVMARDCGGRQEEGLVSGHAHHLMDPQSALSVQHGDHHQGQHGDLHQGQHGDLHQGQHGDRHQGQHGDHHQGQHGDHHPGQHGDLHQGQHGDLHHQPISEHQPMREGHVCTYVEDVQEQLSSVAHHVNGQEVLSSHLMGEEEEMLGNHHVVDHHDGSSSKSLPGHHME